MKFGRIIGCLILTGVVLAAGFALGFHFASVQGSHSEMLAEFKVDYANLEQTELTPQLREYLKSRLYFLASQLEPRDLQGFRFDFGSVDEKSLDGASAVKGPESNADVYAFAMTKHSQKGSRR
jgi:hypothetical protein